MRKVFRSEVRPTLRESPGERLESRTHSALATLRITHHASRYLVRVMEEIGATAWKGKIALLRGDLPAFGRLMDGNHRLVNGLMAHCGVCGEGVEITNRLIAAAWEAGALGAKLTGAGGRGSVFALVRPGEEERVAEAFLQAAQAMGLGGASVYGVEVARHGLRVEQVPVADAAQLASTSGPAMLSIAAPQPAEG